MLDVVWIDALEISCWRGPQRVVIVVDRDVGLLGCLASLGKEPRPTIGWGRYCAEGAGRRALARTVLLSSHPSYHRHSLTSGLTALVSIPSFLTSTVLFPGATFGWGSLLVGGLPGPRTLAVCLTQDPPKVDDVLPP